MCEPPVLQPYLAPITDLSSDIRRLFNLSNNHAFALQRLQAKVKDLEDQGLQAKVKALEGVVSNLGGLVRTQAEAIDSLCRLAQVAPPPSLKQSPEAEVDWVRTWSEKDRRPYFYNRKTNKTSWELDNEKFVDDPCFQELRSRDEVHC